MSRKPRGSFVIDEDDVVELAYYRGNVSALWKHGSRKADRRPCRTRPCAHRLLCQTDDALRPAGAGASARRGRGAASSAFDADWTLKRALSERFRLVIIDEAQWLNREWFEYLRHLLDDPDTVVK